MDEITQEEDGTWTLFIDMLDVKPIKGLPSRELAEHIKEQMWEMERAGARNYAESEN